MGCVSVMSEQVRHNSRLAPSSLPLGKARTSSALPSLNREVVHFELCIVLFPSPQHPFQRLLPAPATGYRNETTGALVNVGTNGGYRSSSPTSSTDAKAGFLEFNSGNVNPVNSGIRAVGRSVRCVQHLQAAFSTGEAYAAGGQATEQGMPSASTRVAMACNSSRGTFSSVGQGVSRSSE